MTNITTHIIHTEDDTFAALSRVDFYEMNTIYVNYIHNNHLQYIAEDLYELCRRHGWVHLDYINQSNMISLYTNGRYLLHKPS